MQKRRRERQFIPFWFLAYEILLLLLLACITVGADEDCSNDDGVCRQVPDTCRLVLAEIPSEQEDESPSAWGIFSLVARERGTPVSGFGDIVIPLTDAPSTLLEDFTWDGGETGSHYEGHESVRSVVPGLGMLANYVSEDQSPNLLPLAPRVDEGGLTRFESPGAGAITHYHNYTIYIFQNVEAGGELFWSDTLRQGNPKSSRENKKPSLQELKQHGYCLDNLKPGKSRIKEAGRGAFATRELAEGSVVAPVPVLAIQKSEVGKQLLRNYCLGHPNSTTLLYPYGPMVNLINHYTEPNVKFQWKNSANLQSPPDSKNPRFLELVATRDIQPGEELYLDYGREWEEAWWHQVGEWKAADFHYTPSYVMDDVIKLLRTEKELKDHPYPENLFTSCFYRYSDRSDDEKIVQPESANKITSFQWKLTKRLYDLRNLRPCKVLKRNEDAKGRSAYAVRMYNRPGLPTQEQIPDGALHIVTHVPRNAIRFSDKAGTTDMHLSYAFRHEIGLPIFPESWMNLAENE